MATLIEDASAFLSALGKGRRRASIITIAILIVLMVAELGYG